MQTWSPWRSPSLHDVKRASLLGPTSTEDERSPRRGDAGVRMAMLRSGVMLLIWIVVALFVQLEVATGFRGIPAAGAVARPQSALPARETLAQVVAFGAVAARRRRRPGCAAIFNGPRPVDTVSGGISMIGEVATVVETVASRRRSDVHGSSHVRISANLPAASSDGEGSPRGPWSKSSTSKGRRSRRRAHRTKGGLPHHGICVADPQAERSRGQMRIADPHSRRSPSCYSSYSL